MKKLILHSITGVACILAFFLFSATTCNDKGSLGNPEPEKCGEKIVDRKWFEDFNAEDLLQRCTYDPETRVSIFGFSAPSQENVCPHEHLNITLEIITCKEPDPFIGARADIMYGILFNYPVEKEIWTKTSDANYNYIKATINFGIKGSFGDDPGWYSIFVDIVVQNSNSCDFAAERFINNIYMIKIEWEHYEYKEP